MTLTRNPASLPWAPLQQEINRLVGAHGNDTTSSNWAPVVDIREDREQFVLQADLPGVEPDAVDITMDDGVLSVRGERKRPTLEEGSDYRRVERNHGTFYRRFALPDTADPDAISARCTGGVLEVVIPKREAVQPRRIPIAA